MDSIENLIPGELISAYKNKKIAQSIVRTLEKEEVATDEEIIRLRIHLALEMAFHVDI